MAVGALLVANVVRDRQMNPAVARFVGSMFAGAAVLSSVFMLDKWEAISLSLVCAVLTIMAKLRFKSLLRGVSGDSPGQSLAEVSFSLSCGGCLIVGWGALYDAVIGAVPILFVAWGDSLAGLSRRTIWMNRPDGVAPSLVMLVACFVIGVLFLETIVSLLASLVAVTVERTRLVIHNGVDDNWLVSGSALLVIAIL